MSNEAYERALQAQREHQESGCRQCYPEWAQDWNTDPEFGRLCPTGADLLDAVSRAIYSADERES